VLAAGLLRGTVGPAEILAHSQAGPVAIGGARILSGGLVLAVITLIGHPGAFRALPRNAWPSLLAASAATATFQGTFLTAAARTGAAVATAVTFGIAPVSTGLCERIMLGTRLPRRWAAGTACAIAGCVLISVPHGAGPTGQARADIYGIACGVLAGGCLSLSIAAGTLLLLGGLVLVSVPRPRAGPGRQPLRARFAAAGLVVSKLSLFSYQKSERSGTGAALFFRMWPHQQRWSRGLAADDDLRNLRDQGLRRNAHESLSSQENAQGGGGE